MVDEFTLGSVAARYNLPPAILAALAGQTGPTGLGYALTPAHVTAAGFSTAELGANDYLQLEMAARILAQSFAVTGNWESALSAYATGDPQAWQSPTGSIGGFVYGTLGQAAAQPTRGMDGFAPANGNIWRNTSSAFTRSMTEISGSGGIVTRDSLGAWHQAAAHAGSMAYDIPAKPIIGSAAPFDPQYDHISQPYGPTSEAMEPAYAGYDHFHEGVDYEVPENSPLRAITGGRVRVNDGGWGGGNAVTVVAPDGSTYLYGHVNTFNVHDGDVVQAGQQIALSGSTGMSTGPHLHFEVRDPKGNLVDGDGLVQTAVTEARTHPSAAGNPHPELVVSGQRQGDVLMSIDRVAQRLGVDPRLARAIAMQESGLDPQSIGDQGTSFGLYQLHQGGELGSHDPGWAFDPQNNAMTALSEVARIQRLNPGMSPGDVAALAQRPADPQGYAASVNALMGTAAVSQPVVLDVPPLPGRGGDPHAQAIQEAANHPDPGAVGEFAQQLQGLGIDVDHFMQVFPFASAIRRKLAFAPTTLADFSKYVGMTTQQVAEAVRQEPHPRYPEVSVGAFTDTHAAAYMHSVNYLHRTPTPTEVAKFASAGMKHTDIANYYQHAAGSIMGGLAQVAAAATGRPPAPDLSRPDPQRQAQQAAEIKQQGPNW